MLKYSYWCASWQAEMNNIKDSSIRSVIRMVCIFHMNPWKPTLSLLKNHKFRTYKNTNKTCILILIYSITQYMEWLKNSDCDTDWNGFTALLWQVYVTLQNLILTRINITSHGAHGVWHIRSYNQNMPQIENVLCTKRTWNVTSRYTILKKTRCV